jgi:site-specific DNA-methyltransferase (adenine-specific)
MSEEVQSLTESEYLYNPASTKYSDFNVSFGEAILSEIDTDGRIREDYGDLEELAKSMDICGLIQPLAVVVTKKGPFKYKLLAGGRRYYTMLTKGIKVVPIRIYSDSLTAEQQRQIELHENIVRKAFTWQERVKMEKELHEAHIKKFGERINPRSDEGWTKKMTAALVGSAPSAITDNLKLAEAVEKHPELQQAKTMQEAKSMLKQLNKKRQNAAAVLQIDSIRRDTPEDRLKEQLAASYKVCNAFDALKTIPDGSIDFIELDPPYGINYQDSRKSASSKVEFDDVPESEFLSFNKLLMAQAQRILKPTGWVTMWFGMKWYEPLFQLCTEFGFKPNRFPIIWLKTVTGGMSLDPSTRLGACYEPVLYMHKGAGKLNIQGHGNVIPCPTIPHTNRIHPTEKPVKLLSELLTIFAPPGSNVLVPFAGSGNTLLAAANCKMNCVGYDLEQSYKDGFVLRVHEGKYGEYNV